LFALRALRKKGATFMSNAEVVKIRAAADKVSGRHPGRRHLI
jgi:hypothetical protein